MALALCVEKRRMPADYVDNALISELQKALLESGQYIPEVEIRDDNNLLNSATVTASSEYNFSGYSHNGNYRRLKFSTAALFPVEGRMPRLTLQAVADEDTRLTVELRCAKRRHGYTPDRTLESVDIDLKAGEQTVTVDFKSEFELSEYIFVCFMANEKVSLGESDDLVSGTTTVLNQINLAVSNYGRQDPPAGIGIESFEFWCPLRRPQGKNIAFTLTPARQIFSLDLMTNSYTRPIGATNAWAASLSDLNPEVTLKWEKPQTINGITLFFDTDYDHAMETVQMGHSENVMPYCVRDCEITDAEGHIIASIKDNYQAMRHITFPHPVETSTLHIRPTHPQHNIPATLFHIIVK